jgi:hypothetical protein
MIRIHIHIYTFEYIYIYIYKYLYKHIYIYVYIKTIKDVFIQIFTQILYMNIGKSRPHVTTSTSTKVANRFPGTSNKVYISQYIDINLDK